MWITLRRTIVLRSTLVALLALLLGAAAGGAVAYRARETDVDRIDRQLRTLIEEALVSGKEIVRLTSEAGDRRVEGARLEAAIGGLQATLAETSARLERAETAQGELGLTYVDLLDERDALQARLDELRVEREDLLAQLEVWSPVTRIDSARLSVDPLLFDPASEASLIRAVCTGSMAPAITCDDTLVVFQPSTQDLDVGDTIIFRAPELDCVGFSLSSTILHRITSVRRSAAGVIEFETKGDALAAPDPCTVPARQVLFEVLAIISDSRFEP
jgi:hypothetical protein